MGANILFARPENPQAVQSKVVRVAGPVNKKDGMVEDGR